MLRALILFVPAVVAAQDAREIMRRALENDGRNAELARSYTYLQRQEEIETDSSGKVKSSKSRTWDVTPVEGSPYRRMVARDDKPLPPDEQREELERLQKSNEERRKETPSQRDKRMAEARKREGRRREPLKELMDAFDFKLVGSETLNGREAWIIDGTPRPGYRPKTQAGGILAKIKARFWVDKAQYQWARMDAETLDTVTFGGVVVRLNKGSRFSGEQIRVNDEVWLPRRWTIIAAARILLLKGMKFNQIYTFSDYKKFSAESRVVSTGVK